MKALSPPLFVNFSSLDEAFQAFSYPENIQDWRALTQRNLPPVISTQFLSLLFGVSPNFISSITRKPNKNYRTFIIKKGKKERVINSPKIGLKLFQTWIGHHLSRAVLLEENVCGFIPGKNGILEAASQHSAAGWLYSIDLRDFFSKINSERVKSALLDLGYPEDSAKLITSLCTLNGCLPQGSPASPVLSNLVFKSTDQIFIDLASKLNIRYTRYADDLVFSVNNNQPENLPQIIKEILNNENWEIAPEKEENLKAPYRLKVHGLVVNGLTPRLTKGYRNRIRAYKHLKNTNKIKDNKEKIQGHLAYADQVDKFFAQKIS